MPTRSIIFEKTRISRADISKTENNLSVYIDKKH